MPRIEPPEYVNGNAGNPDRIRIRQQLRIIIADVLLETGLKLVRLSRRVKPVNAVKWKSTNTVFISDNPQLTQKDIDRLRQYLAKHGFKALHQNEWRGSEEDE